MKSSEQHPSYGVIHISRRSGGSETLFGSSIRHTHKVGITISEAELVRDELHYDRHYPVNPIIEIEMSQSQFAEFITSMNLGTGVPCTISRMRDKEGKYVGVKPCPTTPKREQFEGEFKEQLEQLTNDVSLLVKQTREILGKKTILKCDREELVGLASRLETTIQSHLPFMVGMWNEQMDKTVTEAKGEIAYVDSGWSGRGLQTIGTVWEQHH